MSTPYGVVTREWTEVSNDVHVYKEMEVEGAVEPQPVPNPIVEVKSIPEKKPTPVIESKSNIFKKKRK